MVTSPEYRTIVCILPAPCTHYLTVSGTTDCVLRDKGHIPMYTGACVYRDFNRWINMLIFLWYHCSNDLVSFFQWFYPPPPGSWIPQDKIYAPVHHIDIQPHAKTPCVIYIVNITFLIFYKKPIFSHLAINIERWADSYHAQLWYIGGVCEVRTSGQRWRNILTGLATKLQRKSEHQMYINLLWRNPV